MTHSAPGWDVQKANTLYRKRPVIVEAFRWDGKSGMDWSAPEWLKKAATDRKNRKKRRIFFELDNGEIAIMIKTLEGTMTARSGDWIIRGVEGEIYPCKDSVFMATYEPVHPESEG